MAPQYETTALCFTQLHLIRFQDCMGLYLRTFYTLMIRCIVGAKSHLHCRNSLYPNDISSINIVINSYFIFGCKFTVRIISFSKILVPNTMKFVFLRSFVYVFSNGILKYLWFEVYFSYANFSIFYRPQTVKSWLQFLS